MRHRLFRFFVLACLSVGGSILGIQAAYATHLRAGEITITRKSCSSLDFIITITVYTNQGSPIRFSNDGSGELNFGDGSPIHHPPQKENSPVPGFGPEFGTVTYSVEHTFPGPGLYTISYFEHNRNAGILNMFNSVETPFFIQTVINIDPFLGCDNTPRLLVPPIDKACTGAKWYHNPGAYDPDGDSLSFEMTIPKQDVGRNVDAYRPPNTKEFYAGLDYTHGNEAHDGPPAFSINPVTGTIIWDAPGAAGEYNIAFLIKEWRKIGGVWVQLGYVTRDMQIIVTDCKNRRPELKVPADICVEAGTVINEKIFGTDPDFDSVKIEAFSQVFSINPSRATYSPSPAIYQKTAPGVDAQVSFTWATQCEHIKEQPYQVVFKITDNPPPGSGARLVQFKTWNIRVVGPAPKWKSAQVVPGVHHANLKWARYKCSNAEIIQVWRRIDSFPFAPPVCVTGMPDFLGYTKIAQVSGHDTTYVDTNGGRGLALGAQYCYRLVAVFPLPQGGQSYVSKEICLPPIQADAPVVTNVTVDKTDASNGQITVKWRPPFEANVADFPPPYKYEVFRAEGFSGILKIAKAYPGTKPDTVLVDNDALNTSDIVYNYRIIAHASNGAKDTSTTASSVRLELKPQLKQIELNWSADVPWSNRTQNYPLHVIYRGPAGSTESQMVPIDSVNVNEKSFHYLDSGQYQSTPLKETDVYCYRVMTRGGYGNPKIREPLVNYSQIICAQPNDNTAPCKPDLAVKGIDCRDYLEAVSCTPNTFSNTLTWNRPADLACRADTRSYNIYIAAHVGDDFQLYVQNVRDTFFIDLNLPSFARCYKISAVDRSGNESALSDSFCFDNCPYYELPNVFTPNGDNCNEKFSAYNNRSAIDEHGNDACGPVSADDLAARKTKCARFVNRVDLTVYNRWGKVVYIYSSGGERTIYIDWDGRDDNGKEVVAGVYYYIAQVTFDSVDPGQQHKSIKGWVQVVRGTH
jgi:hypothetical protein